MSNEAHDYAGPEEWRPVPTGDGVEVSSWGRARSNRAANGQPLSDGRWRWAQVGTQSKGYCEIGIGPGRRMLLHRAVAWAFHGDPPTDDAQARHLDGNPAHNAASNVAWGSAADNEADKHRHGTKAVKLDPAKVLDIRRRTEVYGESDAAVAADLGVDRTTIRDVRSGRLWGHVVAAGDLAV